MISSLPYANSSLPARNIAEGYCVNVIILVLDWQGCPGLSWIGKGVRVQADCLARRGLSFVTAAVRIASEWNGQKAAAFPGRLATRI